MTLGRKVRYPALEALLRAKATGTNRRGDIPLPPDSEWIFRQIEEQKSKQALLLERTVQGEAPAAQSSRAAAGAQETRPSASYSNVQLLDYCNGDLGEAERRVIEADVAADSALAARLERLRRNLELLLNDGAGPEPPPRLAQRTINRVARQRAMAGISRRRARTVKCAVIAAYLVVTPIILHLAIPWLYGKLVGRAGHADGPQPSASIWMAVEVIAYTGGLLLLIRQAMKWR